MSVDVIGVGLVVIGLGLFAFELFHPGALLLIPGSMLLVAGLLYIFFPSTLLSTPYGAIALVLAAGAAALIQIPYYRYIAPVHGPMTTTSAGMAGKEAVVVSAIIPNTLRGKVRIGSEIWSAQSDRPIAEGTPVRIVSGEGVSVRVIPADPAGR